MQPNEELVLSLKTDPELLALLGGNPKVFFTALKIKVGDTINDVSPYVLNYPYIVYSEASNKGAFFADNEEQAAEIAWNVKVLHTGSTNEIADRVTEIMAGLGYYRDMRHDMVDSEVYVKVMRFKGGRINAS